ncbi:MAG TPA: DNA primase large subunit PriL [Candidatus Thermoplasmatota archaeon]|nr:DNA primase large subunit PriL [Candidatus Thermoplasmatota archaeon]
MSGMAPTTARALPEHPALLARYPFLPEASALVASAGATLADVLHDRAFAGARSRGLDRVAKALDGDAIPRSTAATPSEAVVEILSWGVARMVASCAGHAMVVRKLAVAESKLLTAHLSGEREEIVEAVAASLGLRTRGLSVALPDYLRHAVTLRDPAWKLVNQRVAAGWVALDARRLGRLAEEALRRRIESELPVDPSPEVRRAFDEPAAAFAAKAKEQAKRFELSSLGEVDLALLPPCMKGILGQLQAGVNAPHTARFAVTSFLHGIGMDAEAIMKLFSKAPDFKESLTRYQVEHITKKGEGQGYTAPGCSTMQSWNVCPLQERDARCLSRGMHHPLIYYRWAMKDKKGSPGKGTVGA